jgi:hypothetical protein
MVSCTCGLLPDPAKVPNIRHDGTLSIGNFMLMMKKPKDLEFEPVHPKNLLLASVVRGISCLFLTSFHENDSRKFLILRDFDVVLTSYSL